MKDGTENTNHEVKSMSTREMFGSDAAYAKFLKTKKRQRSRQQKLVDTENPAGMYRDALRKKIVLELVEWIARHKEILLLSITGSEDFDKCLAQSTEAQFAAKLLQRAMLVSRTFFYGMDPVIAKHQGINLRALPKDHVSIEDVNEFAFALSQMDKTDNFSMKVYLCVSNKRLVDVFAQSQNKDLVERIDKIYRAYMSQKKQADQPLATSSSFESPTSLQDKPIIQSLERVKQIENSPSRANKPVAASSSEACSSKESRLISVAYSSARTNSNHKLTRQKAFNFGRDYEARNKALRI